MSENEEDIHIIRGGDWNVDKETKQDKEIERKKEIYMLRKEVICKLRKKERKRERGTYIIITPIGKL